MFKRGCAKGIDNFEFQQVRRFSYWFGPSANTVVSYNHVNMFTLFLILFQILAFLLKNKKHLLNTHILHLVFSLVGTVRSDRESATIPCIKAFNDLLCDLEVWCSVQSEAEFIKSFNDLLSFNFIFALYYFVLRKAYNYCITISHQLK